MQIAMRSGEPRSRTQAPQPSVETARDRERGWYRPGQPPEEFWPEAADIQREIAPVLIKELSPELEHWATRYGEVGKRNYYLWRWARQGIEVTMLPCVAPELRDEVCDTKVLGVILDVLLDDVADQNGDEAFLEALLRLPLGDTNPDLSRFPPEVQAYGRFTIDLWNEIHARARRYPRYTEFASLLRYDYLQVFNTMRYSHLLNRQPALLNMTEHDLYLPHNMHMIVSGTLDLMCSPSFDLADLGQLREALWHGQCMGRIGNLTTTWERELGEGDFTSGVYARALMEGDLSLAQLAEGDRATIRTAIVAGGHEAFFQERWRVYRRALLARRPRLKSFDLGELVLGLQRLICLHLGSRGYK